MKKLPLVGRRGAEAVRLAPVPELPSDANHAWNVLGVVTEAIKHAETKGALIMAAAGAVGGVLYNLHGGGAHHGIIVDSAVLICGVSGIVAATFAAVCLMPRLRFKDPPSSVIYFHHIVRRHRGASARADYGMMLRTFSAHKDLLIEDIAAQVWVNAQIARQKYRMASLGVVAILVALAALAAVVILTIIS